ncbi:MAG: helix-turn-helix domain-containing protein [Holosporales bacterium]
MSSAVVRSGLASLVETKVREYFKHLNGDRPAHGLYAQIMREVERPLLSLAMEAANGNKVRAAELLGINRNTLRKKLLEHQLITDDSEA